MFYSLLLGELKEEMSEEKEGIGEIVNKLEKGEITIKDARVELKKIGLQHHGTGLTELLLGLTIILGLFLIYLPTVANISQLGFLDFFTQLSVFDFPLIVQILASAIIAVGLIMTVYASHLLSSKGGLKQGDDTIKFIREGPYKIIRHPIAFGMFCLFILHPFVLSNLISYTILAPIGQLILILGMFLGPINEDKMNIRKWGDQYKRYMKEVPRFNFILGLWNFRKK